MGCRSSALVLRRTPQPTSTTIERQHFDPTLPPAAPAFELDQFLLNNSNSCSLDLSNRRCSDLELENKLIPALSPSSASSTLASRQSSTVLMINTPKSEMWMSLNLRNNALSSQSIHKLAACLPASKLQALYLHGNHCGDDGVASLALALSTQNSKLKILGLDGNNVTDCGAQELSRVLAQSSLEWLFLNSNPITDVGLQSLCSVVNASPLKVLGLAKTQVTEHGVRNILLQTCYKSFKLRRVMLDDSAVSPELRLHVRTVLEIRNSAWSQVRITLISVRQVPRLGLRSDFRVLNASIVRRILDLLPYDSKPPPHIVHKLTN